MKSEDKIILSIETGVRGGSISLLKNRAEIDCWIGETGVSKAEDILRQTVKILQRNQIEKKKINLIAISNGPGSATGLRIGRALALGLGKSLGCPLIAVSVLEAMADEIKQGQILIAAVPFGKNQIYWQIHNLENKKKPGEWKLGSPENFLSEIDFRENTILIVHQYLFDSLEAHLKKKLFPRLTIKTTVNLAKLNGQFVIEMRLIR